MKANEITFGIEIECTILIDKAREIGLRVGGYHCGCQIPNLPEGWNAQSDSSIRNEDPTTRIGVEIVSPILKGENGISQVKAVCEWLRVMGAEVNASCGFHVHIGFKNASATQLARLVSLVGRNEKALFAMTGTKSRERGDYCNSIKKHAYREVANGKIDRGSEAFQDRYHALNLKNLAGGRGTVEFRVFAGTTNVFKMLAYVQVCIGLVQKALSTKTKANFDRQENEIPKAKFVKPDGEGQLAVALLLRELGWNYGEGNGWRNQGGASETYQHPLGVIDAELLPQAGIAAMAMAMKYDRR